jgi:drug/metabolite transporter (DMT)-like permease
VTGAVIVVTHGPFLVLGAMALSAGASSCYITLVPVFGVIFSALLLGETVDASMPLGGAMAVVARSS